MNKGKESKYWKEGNQVNLNDLELEERIKYVYK